MTNLTTAYKPYCTKETSQKTSPNPCIVKKKLLQDSLRIFFAVWPFKSCIPWQIDAYGHIIDSGLWYHGQFELDYEHSQEFKL